MPIRKYVSGAQFGPEAIQVMVTAFESARTILNLDKPDDRLTDVVAKKVINLGSRAA